MTKKKVAKKEKKEKVSNWKVLGRNFKKTFKEEIPLLSSESKLDRWMVIIMVILAFVLPFVGFIPLKEIIQPIVELFIQDFGGQAIANFLAVLLIMITFSGFFALSKMIMASIFQQKQKWKKFWIYSMVFGVLLSGFVFIHEVSGAPGTEWKLYNQEIQVAELSCKDSWNKLIEEHMIYCTITDKKIEIENITGELEIELHNGSIVERELEFFAPKNINHISVKIYAISEGKNITLDTGFFPKFYSEEGNYKREKDLLAYLFGLLFISLITIPQLVLKMFDGIREN